VIVCLFTLGNASDAFLILRAVDAGVPAAYVPLLWGAFHVVKSSLATPAGILSDRWSRKSLIVGGWLVYAACYGAWAFASGPAWVVALFLVYGLFAAATEGAERAFVADFVPPERRGTAFGWFHLAVGISALPASVVFGIVWSRYGAPAAFGVSACLAVAASGLLIALPAPGVSRPSGPSAGGPAPGSP
jgi:MFS family permease